MQKTYDVVVIGAGIAGITASIYLKRANLDILLLEKSTPGGQLNKISTIENYPGFSKISGPELTEKLLKQLEEQQVSYRYGNVIEIKNDTIKTIITDQEKIKTKAIILAIGRIPNKLNIDNEESLLNKGISHCALCDGPLFKNKNIAVVGSGNSAIEETLYLSTIAQNVTLIIRGNKLKGEETLITELLKKKNVKILYNNQIKRLIEKNNRLEAIELSNDNIINVEGLFIYIGSTPNLNFLSNLNLETEQNFIKVDSNMQTSIKGIYACGDTINKKVYQLTTATSEATIAAISAKNYIREIKN